MAGNGERQALFRPNSPGYSSNFGHGSFSSKQQTAPSITVPSEEYLDLTISGGKGSSSEFRGEVRATLDDKASLAIVLGDVLLVDTARGIFFPTLWAHINQLGGDKIALGYCVGAFSLGRTLMSPVFGRMSTQHGYRRALLISTFLVYFGAFFYTVADSVFSVFLSQVFLGVGSGTLGVTRGYVADKTTTEQRTYFLAYATAVQYAGFTVMPVLGGLFSYLLGSDEIPLLGRFLTLTQFTAPAFFLMALSTAVFVLVYFVFQDGIRTQPAQRPSSSKELSGAASGVTLATDIGSDVDISSADEDALNQGQTGQWPASEYFPLDSISSSGSLPVEEQGAAGESPPLGADSKRRGSSTLSVVGHYVEISNDSYRSGSDDGKSAEDVEGGYQTGLAAVAADSGRVYVSINDSEEYEARDGEVRKETSKTLGEGVGAWLARKLRVHLPSRGDMLIYGGFLLNVSTKGTIACFETIGAEYAMTNFSLTSAEAGSMFATCGAIGVAALLSMRLLCKRFNDIQLVLGGMSLMILTCVILAFPPSLTGLHVFVVAVFLIYSVGYPIGHTAVLGLFSKVVGAQPQGTLMGWFGSAGAMARTFFPVLTGVLSQELGSAALFLFLVGILSVTFVLLFAFRKPYLDCVKVTDRRKVAAAPASPPTGGAVK